MLQRRPQGTALRAACLLTIALLAAGCDRSWDAYNEIQLGKPVPAQSILAEKGAEVEGGWGWDRHIIRRLPVLFGSRKVSVKTDKNGLAIAKTHLVAASINGLFFNVASCHMEQEILIPKAMQSDLAEGKMTQEAFLAWCEKSISNNPSDPRKLVDGHEWEGSTVDRLFVNTQIALGSVESHADGLSFIMKQAPGLFVGLEKKGFDRQFWRKPIFCSTSFRIWNPDGQRIRVESYAGAFNDPLFVVPIIINNITPDSEKEFIHSRDNSTLANE